MCAGVTYVNIDLYMHIYIPNQAMRVAKLYAFSLFLSIQNTTLMRRSHDHDFEFEL